MLAWRAIRRIGPDCLLGEERISKLVPRDVSPMSDKSPKRPSKRQYPPVYEKFIPIALVLIALAIVIVLVVVFGVVLGLFP
jgi:hypothetical protein